MRRSEVVSLVPVLIALFVHAPAVGDRGPAWNAVLLFGGMIVSRVGLWSYDLSQTKSAAMSIYSPDRAVMQLALQDHPRRNSLMALQFAIQARRPRVASADIPERARPRQVCSHARPGDASALSLGGARLGGGMHCRRRALLGLHADGTRPSRSPARMVAAAEGEVVASMPGERASDRSRLTLAQLR